MATNPNTADAIIYSHKIMSALDSDALMPEVAEKLYRPYGDEWREYLRLKMLGFNTMTGNEDYSFHQKDRIYTSITATAVGTISSNTLEITAGTAGTPLYVRAKDVLMWKEGSSDTAPETLRLLVVSVNKSANKFTVTTLNSSDSLPTTGKVIKTGSIFVIYTGVSGEGSASVDPAFSRTRKFTNNLQIIDEKISATGSLITDQLWFEIGGSKTGDGMYSDALADGEYRMLTKIAGMWWFGQTGGNQIDPTSEVSGVQRTSQGLFDSIDTNGNIVTGFDGTLAKHDLIAANIIANNGSTTSPVWMGIGFDLMNDIEDAIFGQFTPDQSFLEKQVNDKLWKTNNSYGSFVNFKYWQRHQFTYVYETIPMFSNSTTYGQFSDLAKEGVAIPVGEARDQVNGNRFGTMGMRYKSNGKLDRKFMTDELIGFGSNKKGEQIVKEVDTRVALWKAHVGNQFMEVENMSHLKTA